MAQGLFLKDVAFGPLPRLMTRAGERTDQCNVRKARFLGNIEDGKNDWKVVEIL